MMNNRQRLAELYQRRADLLARSATQRTELAEACYAWRFPLAMADRGLAAWRFVHKHPAVLVGAGAILALTRPRLTLALFRRGWMLWRVYRGLAGRGG